MIFYQKKGYSMKEKQSGVNSLFSDIAKANAEWFDTLLGTNKTNIHPGSIIDMYKQVFDNTKEYLEVHQNFYKDQVSLWQDFFANIKSNMANDSDKRFSDPDWHNNPFFAYLKKSYLSMSNTLLDFISKAEMDEESKVRMKFFMSQYLDAISPSNFPFTNPEAIKGAIETKGESLLTGFRNMLQDAQNGYIAMTDESNFEVGKNLAVTEGKVVFKNELIELIQYSPTTEKVYEVPLLIVPPCINKYYILDLQQENSLVKFLVEQGYTVFLISWKSADKATKSFRWEEYINLGVIEAVRVVRAISKCEQINTLGYCIGGIILTTAYLVMQARKLDWIKSMSHMTTMLDHTDPGDIKFFINRDLLLLKEARSTGGTMSGRIIAQTFSTLRANDLIWNYWVNNYLLGKTPKAFDILYWNNDVVDLPIPLHTFLLKRLYSQNDLIHDKLVIDGIKMDLHKIDCPMYLFAAQKDHIVPWISAYNTTRFVKGDVRFVLGASGHTAGVVNPASLDKRNYWINQDLPRNAEDWLKNAKEMPGSWWKDFNLWLTDYAGKQVKAKKTLGNTEFKPLCDAPGENVRAKALPVIEAGLV